MIAREKTCVKKAGAGLPEGSMGTARRGMKKTAAPAGAGTAEKGTSIISLQHSTEQFEGKEKRDCQTNSNQNKKRTICHEGSPPLVS